MKTKTLITVLSVATATFFVSSQVLADDNSDMLANKRFEQKMNTHEVNTSKNHSAVIANSILNDNHTHIQSAGNMSHNDSNNMDNSKHANNGIVTGQIGSVAVDASAHNNTNSGAQVGKVNMGDVNMGQQIGRVNDNHGVQAGMVGNTGTEVNANVNHSKNIQANGNNVNTGTQTNLSGYQTGNTGKIIQNNSVQNSQGADSSFNIGGN